MGKQIDLDSHPDSCHLRDLTAWASYVCDLSILIYKMAAVVSLEVL